VEGRVGEPERLARVVREDENVVVERRLVAPPAVRVRVALPRAFPAAEHLPAHDRRPGAAELLVDDVRVGVGLTAAETVSLTPRLRSERPLVQLLAALAQRVLE
jgi:hypothetical protein